ncbi:unnamed protein product [Didymodactylos carnosus]|uniref:RNA helicase n=1 Tax=Didymodactylos carnosus TaxID=1234261 RepID=A0A813R6D3_9BILA|nr:unnamed protein product [Didymodactylos carnosus]CAF0777684.1 unnamed protein product [Didymodactylos carnosus]CAF3527951.1 unnamed protein product [Didymodactylos carnosus]CAF3560416.1 unnamed protein product [Didymodactylos carnosus]
MDELEKLEYLSLVSKICTELDNHLGVNDMVLAEFIIYLAQTASSYDTFKNELSANQAEFPDSFSGNLYRIVQKMLPSKPANKKSSTTHEQHQVNDTSLRKALCPALALPNEPSVRTMLDEELKAKAVPSKEDEKVVDDTMNELENLMVKAKNQNTKSEKEDNRSDRKKNRYSPPSSKSRHRHHHDKEDDGKKRSHDKSRKRHRRSSVSDSSSRSGSDRSVSPAHQSSKKKKYIDEDHKRKNNNDSPRQSKQKQMSDEPEVGTIYDGIVISIMQWGCFVRLEKFRNRTEGLVHISNIHKERINNVSDVVTRHQKVKVKVLAYTKTKMSLSMKDVDQKTGEDLNEEMTRKLRGEESIESASYSMGRNPDRPIDLLLNDRQQQQTQSKETSGRKKKQVSDYDLWEYQQMLAASCIAKTQLPYYDEETGVLPKDDDSDGEDVEIELVDEEAPFLKGYGKQSTQDLSPVKIVKNPDGSLQQAAMMQNALSKERRELKQAQREQQQRSETFRPDGMNYDDPMNADGNSRATTTGTDGTKSTAQMSEWKKSLMNHRTTYGKRTTMTIMEQRESLPIYRLKEQLLKAVHDNQVLIVIGETGSGKTTQITQYLAEVGYTSRGKIACTQPRRVAAMSVAKRVAEEYGCRLGQEVGYTIRFEDCTSPETKIKYMTDGMLLRECLIDPDMNQYSIVMLDEAHERTIHTDVLFGLMKQAVQKRGELKLIVTSATLDSVKFSEYFFKAPIFTIPGRTFPVEVLYTKEPETDYLDASLITVMQIHLTEPPGDILVFLTGQEEIDTACEILFERMKSLGSDVPELIILPVYSALPSEMQTKIFDPAPLGSRKVVIATNIAETSLTIDGIYYVVDPGFVKQKVFNPKTGMDSLVVTPISQAQAKQRMGRAGRTGPGKAYRLYTERAYRDEMLATNVPEIQRTNLASTVLSLKAMGINDLLSFDFMDPPPLETMIMAMEQLHALSALDDEGLLTRLGRRMAEFPLEPQLSKMLIMSVQLGCSEEALTIVSMLSVQNVFYRPKEKAEQADQRKARFHQAEGDHLTLLAVYNAWKTNKFSNLWCYDNFVQQRSLKRAQDIRKQMLGIMDRHKLDVLSCGRNTGLVQKAICSGFFRNAAKRDPQEGYRTLVDSQVVYIHPSSSIYHRQPEWLCYHELVFTTKEYMREVCVADPKWLVEFAPKFFKFGDSTRLSKMKKEQRVEPLFNKYEEPNSWRISRLRRPYYNPAGKFG